MHAIVLINTAPRSLAKNIYCEKGLNLPNRVKRVPCKRHVPNQRREMTSEDFQIDFQSSLLKQSMKTSEICVQKLVQNHMNVLFRAILRLSLTSCTFISVHQ